MKHTHGSGMHSVTPAHSIEDLKLSYMYNLSREGILSSKDGTINNSVVINEFRGLKPDSPEI